MNVTYPIFNSTFPDVEHELHQDTRGSCQRLVERPAVAHEEQDQNIPHNNIYYRRETN